jgi:two-component system NtrC family response regulator
MIIDDNDLLCETVLDLVEELGHQGVFALTLSQGLEMAQEHEPDVVLLDVKLPDGNGLDKLPDIRHAPSNPEVIILTGAGGEEGAELAIRNGAWDYIQKGSSLETIRLPIMRCLEYRKEKLQSQTGEPRPDPCGIVGQSQPLRRCLDMMGRAAEGDAPVLITGETGSGKELFAQALHANSRRSQGPLVTVDCAALPESLAESELFGHVRGAFTGAEQERDGLVAQAHGGSLFLDEIGDLPQALQKTFLRVLQEKRFRKIGGKKEIHSDFRLIAATNRDLEAMVRDGAFRQDLLYRIRALTIELPPLRERKEDIPLLARRFIRKACERLSRNEMNMAEEFLHMLLAYDWPGNVREFANTMESVIAFSRSVQTLHPVHLPEHIRIKAIQSRREENEAETACEAEAELEDEAYGYDPPPWKEFREEAMRKAEEIYFRNLHSYTNGDMKKALEISGLSKARFYKLMRSTGVS